jgi:YHS domain-containing protein
MKTRMSFGLAVAAVAAVLGAALWVDGTAQAAKEGGEETEITHLYGNHACPVSEDKVDPAAFYEYKDEENHVYARIYVCCEGCLKKTEEKAAELYKTLYLTDKDGKEVAAKDLENDACPISGKDVAEKIEYNGKKIGFCCLNCPKAFLKDPEKHMAKLLPDAEEFEFEAGAGHGKDN